MRLRVRDIDSVIKALDAAGVHIVSHGGEPVTLKGGANAVRVANTGAPDNLFVQVMQ